MEIYFTRDHEWIKLEGNTGIVGITAYAAHQLGDITYVELPKEGKEFKKGDVLCTIESVKAASDVFTPMSGKVIEVNNSLISSPQIVNEKPESDGWIAKMELSDLSEKNSLMDQKAYDEFLKTL